MVIRTGAAALCMAVAVSSQSPANKVGVISIQGAIAGTKDGQKALQQLETKFQPKQKDFDHRQSELSQLQDQFKKGGSVLSEEKRNGLAREIDRKRRALERDMSDAKDEFATEQERVLQGLGQQMLTLIEKYAKDNGYSLVLDVSNPNTPVLYRSSAIDLTQDIIALYNKGSLTPAHPAAK
jgi:outer membrane protein